MDYFQARKVATVDLAPVLDPKVRALMQQFGEFLIRPKQGKPDIYEIAGRMPTPSEEDAFLNGRLAGLLKPRLDRRQTKRKMLFL